MHDQNNILQGSLSKAIWQMLWPLLAYALTVSVSTLADTWVAGKMGSEAQAAIATGELLWFFTILLAIGLSTGSAALVSRFWGAQDRENAVMAAKQAILFSIIVGILATLSSLTICMPVLAALGLSESMQDLSWTYLQFNLVSLLPFTMLYVINAIFRAIGETRVPLYSMLLVTTLVVILDYALCIQPLNLGVKGIGMAWGIAGTCGVWYCLIKLRQSKLAIKVSWENLKLTSLSPEWCFKLMKIGIPSCLRDLTNLGASFAMLYIFTRCTNPVVAMAAWAIGVKFEDMIIGVVNNSLAHAVAPIVGQNLGAGKKERAERAGWEAAKIGILLACCMSAISVFFAYPIASFMSHDPQVVEYAAKYLQIVGLAQPFVAAWYCLAGAMEGAAYVRKPVLVSTNLILFLRLPLCWILTITMLMGPNGAWLGIAFSDVVIACAIFWIYKKGKWKNQAI